MFTFEEFEKINKSHWLDYQMQKNYAIALKVEADYYLRYGTTKCKEPKIGDIVEYADEYHVYKYAKIVENLYYEDENTRVCICENGRSHTNGKSFTTSGGAFHGMDKSALQYVGEDINYVWTWGCEGPGANQGINLPLKVNKWIIPYDPHKIKRSTIQFKTGKTDEKESVCIVNSDSWMFNAMSFNSVQAFKAWAKYVGYEYHEENNRTWSPQEVITHCWTSNNSKPTNGKPLKVLGNGYVHDGLVTTEEFRIIQWWPNIWYPGKQEPAYGTPEYHKKIREYEKYASNPMGV